MASEQSRSRTAGVVTTENIESDVDTKILVNGNFSPGSQDTSNNTNDVSSASSSSKPRTLSLSSSESSSSSTHSGRHILKYFRRRPDSSKSSGGSSGTNSKVKSSTESGVTGSQQGTSNSSNSEPFNEGLCTFKVGVAEDRNRKCRRSMEDAHTFIYNFGEVPDTGYFGIFDGHAGRAAADWCSKKLHSLVEENILKNDKLYSRQASQQGKSSPEGSKLSLSTRVPVAFEQSFNEADAQMKKLPIQNSGCTAAVAVIRWEDEEDADTLTLNSQSTTKSRARYLYTANVGDSRVVLSRGGKALRLSYDHKGSDPIESQRISNCGGIMVNNRVNGVLAVTRSLGDSYMKELVTGAPYTTRTLLGPEDDFIIVACDGLWDVCDDQTAVTLIRNLEDPQQAAKALVDHALQSFSSDNLTCMVVRLSHAD